MENTISEETAEKLTKAFEGLSTNMQEMLEVQKKSKIEYEKVLTSVIKASIIEHFVRYYTSFFKFDWKYPINRFRYFFLPAYKVVVLLDLKRLEMEERLVKIDNSKYCLKETALDHQ